VMKFDSEDKGVLSLHFLVSRSLETLALNDNDTKFQVLWKKLLSMQVDTNPHYHIIITIGVRLRSC